MKVCISLGGARILAFLFRVRDISVGFPHRLRMKIETKKVGGIWHGYLEGHPEVDERGLTEEIALRKVERIIGKLECENDESGRTRSTDTGVGGKSYAASARNLRRQK